MGHSSSIHLHWKRGLPLNRFRTGVSLHSHTLHSRESLSFIYGCAKAWPFIASAVRRGEQRYREFHDTDLDFSRGWWTPPLGAHDAWTLEKDQITALNLNALVSLTDHDDIEAPMLLQILEECRDTPISFEWTVPYQRTFFHLGVHNLRPSKARRLFADLQSYTKHPAHVGQAFLPAAGLPPGVPPIGDLLQALSSVPGTLIVFNHPLWDESRIGREIHRAAAEEFLRLYGDHLHALEINGLRPWRENREVIEFAATINKAVISGGDRHGLEPNANLNLTNASTFGEFVDEIRSGWSDILIMPQYRISHAVRIVQNLVDILRTQDRHTNGWRLWSDRVFYQCDDGQVRSLTTLFGNTPPASVSCFLGMVEFAARPRVRRLLHDVFSTGEGVVL
jgi:hypothetical protein